MDAGKRPQHDGDAPPGDDLAPTAEFRAFLAGEPVAAGDRDQRPSRGWLGRLLGRLQGRRPGG